MSNDGMDTARLIVEPSAGTQFQLRDGELKILGDGHERFDRELRAGLYLLEWRSAGKVEQEILTLLGGKPVIKRAPGARAGHPSESLRETSEDKPFDLAAFVDRHLRPEALGVRESSVAIVLTTGPEAANAAAQALQIVDWTEAVQPERPDPAPALPSEFYGQVRLFDLSPGRYRVRFRAITGEIWEQSLPVLPGRRTVVSLSAAAVDVVVADGNKFTKQATIGVDPTKTLIVTIAGDETARRLRDRIRLAGVLLHDLASGGTSLTNRFVDILDDPAADPLLRLYGALVVVSRIVVGKEPSLELDIDGIKIDETYTVTWLRRAADWVSKPTLPGLPTDAIALWWQFARFVPSASEDREGTKVQQRIEVPPMFELSWQWAISFSVEHPRAVPNTALNLATGRSASGTAPWLCWRTAAMKAAAAQVPLPAGQPDVDAQLKSIVAKLEKAGNSRRKAALEEVSADTRDLVVRIGQAKAQQSDREGAEQPSVGSVLAVALGLPAAQLSRRLAKAEAELDAALGLKQHLKGTGSTLDLPSKHEAPGLARKVRYQDDKHRGRFGGEPARGGFELSAEFEVRTKQWTRIELTLRGPAKAGEIAYFYLHDSFRPPDRTREFRRRKAEVIVTAWGGFTVGVWIPSRHIQLELNLAKCKGAPKPIRTR